ncbi:hypothetical protein IV498_14030 [Paenarthrobacter sp. Z7-10]|nr:hypothetical protein [Paenarthrobacter sp. Z7-10]
MSISVGGSAFEVGQAFGSPVLVPISGGYDFGGRHWDVAYQLPASKIEPME